MKKVTVIIERGKDGTYGAYLADGHDLPFGIVGDGNTVEEARRDLLASFEDMRHYYEETGKDFPDGVEFVFKYDAASFLQEYSGRLSLTGLQAITGINRKQLSHYLTGHRRPSEKTVHKIEEAVHRFTDELSKVSLV